MEIAVLEYKPAWKPHSDLIQKDALTHCKTQLETSYSRASVWLLPCHCPPLKEDDSEMSVDLSLAARNHPRLFPGGILLCQLRWTEFLLPFPTHFPMRSFLHKSPGGFNPRVFLLLQHFELQQNHGGPTSHTMMHPKPSQLVASPAVFQGCPASRTGKTAPSSAVPSSLPCSAVTAWHYR